jgi:urease accessory protein
MLIARLHCAWSASDALAVQHWRAQLIAARETPELRAEELHLGRALAAVRWRIRATDALCG